MGFDVTVIYYETEYTKVDGDITPCGSEPDYPYSTRQRTATIGCYVVGDLVTWSRMIGENVVMGLEMDFDIVMANITAFIKVVYSADLLLENMIEGHPYDVPLEAYIHLCEASRAIKDTDVPVLLFH